MRDVNPGDAALKALADATVQYPQIQSRWEALCWRIAKRPETGVSVNSQFYTYKQQRVRSTDPDLLIVYEFDNNSVTIHMLRIIP
jgi:hypothetical protein